MNESVWENSTVNMSTVSPITESVPYPDQGFVIGMYSVLFGVGATGNIGVLISLVRSRRRKSRVNLLMTHLVIADLMVIFIVIPLEVII